MAKELQLSVVLKALDKASGPLGKIHASSSGLGRSLKATSDNIKGLNAVQRNIGDFKRYQTALGETGGALEEARAKMGALERAAEHQRSVQTGLAAETRIHRQAVRNLQREMVRAKEPSAELSRQYALAKDNLTKLETKYQGSQNLLRRYKKDLTETSARAAGLSSKHQELGKHLGDVKTKLEAAGLSTDKLADHEKALADGLERANKLLEAQRTKLKALENLRAKASNVREAGGQVAGQARSLGTQAAVAGAAGGYFFKTQFLDRAAEFEKYQTILKTVTGSELKAGQAMSWVSEFAARTPYEMGEVMESFTRLKAYGIDPMANGMLKTLGDTASAMGKPVMQAVEAMADAVTGENERLKEFGIKGSKIKGTNLIEYSYTDAAGKNLTKQVDGTNRALIQSTLQSIWNEKYRGAMEDQSKTWNGMISNMGDQWARFTNLVMASGLFDRMKERLGGLLNQLDTMAANGQLADWASRVGGGMLKFADGAWKAGEAFMRVSNNIAGAVGGWENLLYITAAMKFAPLAFGLVKLGGALIGAGGALLKVVGASAAFVKAGALISAAVRGVGIALWGLAANPAALAIAGIAAGVAGAAYLIYRNWEPIKTFFLGMWGEIKMGFSGGFAGIAATIVNFSPLGLLYKAFAGALSYLGVELPGRFTEFGGMLMQGLANGIKNMAGTVKGAVVGAADSSIGWFKEKLGIHSPSRVFAELGGFTMAGLAQGLAGGEDGPLKQITGTVKRLTAAGVVGLSAATGAFPAAAGEPISIDTRPPLATSSAASAARGGDVFNVRVTVQVQGGGDPNAIAAAVRREFESIQREAAARRRSSFHDLE